MMEQLIKKGKAMRALQKRYFHVAKEARAKQYIPEILRERDKVLEQSKQAEREFDQLCEELEAKLEAEKQMNLFP